MIAASLAGATLSLPAISATEIFFNNAPPPTRHEAIPVPRRGYVWAPGYWDARAKKHSWRNGHWERQRAGHYYVQPRWVERNNGWALERGRWNRGDRDGDGIPNSRDRHPDDPRR